MQAEKPLTSLKGSYVLNPKDKPESQERSSHGYQSPASSLTAINVQLIVRRVSFLVTTVSYNQQFVDE